MSGMLAGATPPRPSSRSCGSSRPRVLCLPPAVLALLVLSLCAPLSAAPAARPSGFSTLVAAIKKANENAAKCVGEYNCLGDLESLTLTQDVTLTGPLPELEEGANLAVKGQCTNSSSTAIRGCVIDGAKKFQIFKSVAPGNNTGALSLSNLKFTRAKGGVLVDLWATVVVRTCAFDSNTGGVVLDGISPTGWPSRTFSSCSFTNNIGTAISAGTLKYGMSTGTAYVISQCVFQRNSGAPKAPLNSLNSTTSPKGRGGGAIAFAGFGSSVISDTVFSENLSYGNGGAVLMDTTTVKFKRTAFIKNKALNGRGGAVFAPAGDYGDSKVTLCSCSFIGNLATKSPTSESLLVSTPPAATSSAFAGIGTAIFCGTSIPIRSDLSTASVYSNPNKHCKVGGC